MVSDFPGAVRPLGDARVATQRSACPLVEAQLGIPQLALRRCAVRPRAADVLERSARANILVISSKYSPLSHAASPIPLAHGEANLLQRRVRARIHQTCEGWRQGDEGCLEKGGRHGRERSRVREGVCEEGVKPWGMRRLHNVWI